MANNGEPTKLDHALTRMHEAQDALDDAQAEYITTDKDMGDRLDAATEGGYTVIDPSRLPPEYIEALIKKYGEGITSTHSED